MKVVHAIPTAPKAKPMSTAAGTASTAPGSEGTSPAISAMTRKPTPYSAPRSCEKVISPTAMSPGRMGVASTAS
jgi:hypothetical protein